MHDGVMMRATVVVDRELVERVKRLYGAKTTSAAIDLALRSLLPISDKKKILEMEGVGWDGDLPEIRRPRPFPS